MVLLTGLQERLLGEVRRAGSLHIALWDRRRSRTAAQLARKGLIYWNGGWRVIKEGREERVSQFNQTTAPIPAPIADDGFRGNGLETLDRSYSDYLREH